MSNHENTAKFMAFTPAADVVENEHGWQIIMDMPGAGQENLDIQLNDHLLQISAVTGLSHRGMAVKYERSFQLSDEIDRQQIKASLKDGVLDMFLPKAESAKVRKITVARAS